MGAFEAGLGALFNDPALSVAATFTPQIGSPVTVRAILRRPDIQAGMMIAPGAVQESDVADVRVSELAGVAEGDAILINAVNYIVKRASHPDPQRLIWRLSLRAA